MKARTWFIIAGIVLVFSTFYSINLANNSFGLSDVESGKEDLPSTNEGLVDPSELVAGGPPKDGIPSIDNSEFVSVSESDWISNEADVFILAGDEVKIYPQPILVWHEIVNDFFDGKAVAVTYCPLCGSSIAFERVIDGENVEFGTSGKLYNSNLVMYDRKTESYWSQIRGEAIIGELSGMRLEKVPMQTMKWGDAKERFPDAKVLSRETGFVRNYGVDPYSGYYTSEEVMFPVDNQDSRLSSKAIIIGLEIKGDSKAYPEFLLQDNTVEDTLGGEKITLDMEDEFLRITNEKGERVAWERDFWFAWVAFHPETMLYDE